MIKFEFLKKATCKKMGKEKLEASNLEENEKMVCKNGGRRDRKTLPPAKQLPTAAEQAGDQ